jgi:hypothetical protein
MGDAYAPCPMPGTDAFVATTRKWKASVEGKLAAKKAKVALAKKVGVVKIIWLMPKPGPTGMSKIELALAKPIRVHKKFCFSDVSC